MYWDVELWDSAAGEGKRISLHGSPDTQPQSRTAIANAAPPCPCSLVE